MVEPPDEKCDWAWTGLSQKDRGVRAEIARGVKHPAAYGANLIRLRFRELMTQSVTQRGSRDWVRWRLSLRPRIGGDNIGIVEHVFAGDILDRSIAFGARSKLFLRAAFGLHALLFLTLHFLLALLKC